VTIVSFHEQFNGWTKFIARAKASSGLVRGYTELEGVIDTFARAQVLPFSTAAAEVYVDLRARKVRVGAMDLRIASIAIANRMTLKRRVRAPGRTDLVHLKIRPEPVPLQSYPSGFDLGLRWAAVGE
jgi:tRNA(fMet)-specific endonuclease VapC